MLVHIIRHGQTSWNLGHLIQGHTNIPLNLKGIEESLKLKENLKNIKFEACFSSDLDRAKDTARIISDLPIIIDSRLRERNFGMWEGKTKQEFIEKSNGNDYENDDSVNERFFSFLEDLKNKNFSNVLIVSHGGVMRSFISKRLGIKTTPKNMFDISIKNTECLKFIL